MQGIKIAILVALAHLSRICATLVIIKLIAVKLGPDGMGFLGNYMSLISIATVMAGGGVTSGIIKYVSEYSDDIARRDLFIKNAFLYSVFFSLVFLVIVYPFSKIVANYIFGLESYAAYIKLFLVAQLINGLTNFFYGVFNGMRENWMYSLSVLSANFSFLLVAYFVIEKYALQGSIIALTMPLFISVIPAWYLFHRKKINVNIFVFENFLEDSSKLFKYTLMILFSSICFPMVEIYIRKLVLEFLNLNSVGLWQATMKLSTAYLSFFSVFLSFYLIPRISAENNFNKIRGRVISSMGFILIFFVGIFSVFIVDSRFVIDLVFSDSFYEIEKYIFYQIAGDFFRVIGWAIGFVVVARAATKIYIFGEIFQGVSFLIFVVIFLNLKFEVNGVVYAYLVGNIAYCIAACIGFFVVYKKRFER